MDEELETAKENFLALLKETDPVVQSVIPVRSTNDHFLISLTKSGKREFISVSEGDLLDLEEVPEVKKEVAEKIQTALQKIGA